VSSTVEKGCQTRIRVVVQNVNQGGLTDGNGHPEGRWPLLAERINAVAPDVLLLNEARGWTANGYRQLGRALRRFRVNNSGGQRR
jgi:hypothetical protein